MKKIFYSAIFFTTMIFSSGMLLTGCSKDDSADNVTVDNQTGKAYFESAVANQDLIVVSAIDNGTNITSSFSGYTVHITDSAALSGGVTVNTELKNVAGAWSTEVTYSKIVFNFPTLDVPRLAFLNREWMISAKGASTTTFTPTDGYNATLVLSKK